MAWVESKFLGGGVDNYIFGNPNMKNFNSGVSGTNQAGVGTVIGNRTCPNFATGYWIVANNPIRMNGYTKIYTCIHYYSALTFVYFFTKTKPTSIAECKAIPDSDKIRKSYSGTSANYKVSEELPLPRAFEGDYYVGCYCEHSGYDASLYVFSLEY